MPVKIYATALGLFFIVFMLSSKISYSQSYKNEIGAMAENDVYIAYLQDRYYTNGFFAYYRHALEQENLKPRLEKKIVDLEIGQKIYNPYSAHAPDVKLHDRPFAGYLYGSAAMGWFYKSEAILKASAQIGIIGPHAFGEEMQTAFHKLIGTYTVQGWEYQVKDELALNLNFSYQQPVYHTVNQKLDFSGTSSVLLGNTFSGANIGLLIRFGNMNPFYESSYANSRIKNKQGDNRKTDREFFFFTKPQVNFVAYDATIQGGLFNADKGPVTFGIKHWVYSQELGINFASKRWNSKFIVTLKTQEIDGSAKAYHYGSAILAYSFN
ncbi:lipid A deacylase LpxR family protein [Pedobacter insulae]|uniref:Lipid A deacylase LpxR family protein n=1 Tax=Pedobacter insulae TaxID=414048 RepID=A0A1I2TM92_9SPHI|nr:lipid A deacylase LpxR family protein [Pedobacter insulae]SFG65988.1 hypothetical protein SAMN04489864_101487 [Pedobacter insulae]